MKKIFILFVFFFFLSNNVLFARRFYVDENVEKYREYNPDGKKYKFIKRYLTSLSYLYLNTEAKETLSPITFDYFKDPENIIGLQNHLTMENVNLRVARNLLKKYKKSENGLILKVTDIFVKMCNEQIEMNIEEKKYSDQVYKNLVGGNLGQEKRREVIQWYEDINEKKKKSSMKLLESSMLASKVLISEKTDGYGELSYLAINSKDKEALIGMLDEFIGEEYSGNLREGQTFLGGSISAIREILENSDFDILSR